MEIFETTGNGFPSSGKVVTNGLVQSGYSAITLGFGTTNGPFLLNDRDLAMGAGYSQALANASGTIFIGVASGGAGCVGGRIGQAVQLYDLAGNVAGVGQGAADIYSNGLTFQNGVQVIGSSLDLAGNALAKCFTAGTQVVVDTEFTEDGVFVQYVTMNIEDIQVGDWVYSYDTDTGEVSQKQVSAVFERKSDHINFLTILDAAGNEQTIETTDGHPFWVVTDDPGLSRAARSVVDENGVILYHENIEPGLNGFWVEAKDLRIGDVFLGANGELSTLTNIVRIEQDEDIAVFNFTVEGNHNYFILAKEYEYGQTCVLVHNANYKNTKDLAEELSAKIGKNRITIETPNKKIDYDLKGKPHFDKPTGTIIDTPHVHENLFARGPNGEINIDRANSISRMATPQDIRIVKKFLNE